MKTNRYKPVLCLNVVLFVISVLACISYSGAAASHPYPELLGTWVSTGKVAPAVKFTIGNNLLKTLNPGESNPQYFYNGEVVCSALAGNKYAFTKFDDVHYIMVGRDIIDDVEYPMVQLTAADASGKSVYIRAQLRDHQLVGNVSVGKYPKYTYDTPKGSKDIFVKQK